jgi:hypothetical protein
MTDPAKRYPILLSVVMVVTGWVEQAPGIVAAMAEQLATIATDYEIILVDNASDGDAQQVYRAITAPEGHPNVQVYRLLRKVDYEIAAWAGVENSLGDLILVIDPFDDDLTPLRGAVAEVIDGQADLVLLVNDSPRRQPPLTAGLRRLYLALFRSLGGINLQVEAAQYRLMTKRVVSYLLQQPRPANRYRTLPATAGFTKAILRYTSARRPRPANGLLSEARRGMRILLSSSIAPARIASVLSLLGAGLNVVYSIYVVVLALTRSNLQPGWITTSLQQSGMFFLFSLLAFVLTEYLIDGIQGGRVGTAYFVIDELSSAVLTRRQRLNVETQGGVIRADETIPEAPGGGTA